MTDSRQRVDERLRQLDRMLTNTMHIAVVKFVSLNNWLFAVGNCWPGGRPMPRQHVHENDRTGSDKLHFSRCVSECDDEV
jgi:hypothetical protein